jgi:hypothetical protein
MNLHFRKKHAFRVVRVFARYEKNRFLAKYPEGVAVRLPGPSGKPLEISKWGGMGQIFGMDVDFCWNDRVFQSFWILKSRKAARDAEKRKLYTWRVTAPSFPKFRKNACWIFAHMTVYCGHFEFRKSQKQPETEKSASSTPGGCPRHPFQNFGNVHVEFSRIWQCISVILNLGIQKSDKKWKIPRLDREGGGGAHIYEKTFFG